LILGLKKAPARTPPKKLEQLQLKADRETAGVSMAHSEGVVVCELKPLLALMEGEEVSKVCEEL